MSHWVRAWETPRSFSQTPLSSEIPMVSGAHDGGSGWCRFPQTRTPISAPGTLIARWANLARYGFWGEASGQTVLHASLRDRERKRFAGYTPDDALRARSGRLHWTQ